MMALAHAGLSWTIGSVVPFSDRRLRIWCTAAARRSYVSSGVNPVGLLEPFLQELGKDPDPATREAAAQCLDLLQGRNPFQARG